MEQGFRASMNWLHTWSGVVLGGLLFAIFWMGTLSVFDREIDRWMAPMIRLPAAEKPFSLEVLRPLYEAAAAAKSPIFSVGLPTDRDAAMRVLWRDQSGPVHRFVDPGTGAVLPDPGTLGGTRFIFPFHYMLHIRIQNIGYWLVGLAGMAMMALCVSGVIIHRKIFTDFFTFRPDRKPRRLILDLHNVTGVLGLPFHFLISLSGLVIFWSTYFPSSWQVTYNGDRLAFFADAYGNVIPKRTGEARRHGLVRRHGRRGAAPVGRLGAALRLRPQSRRCKVGRCRSAASTRGSSAAPTTRPISTGRPGR